MVVKDGSFTSSSAKSITIMQTKSHPEKTGSLYFKLESSRTLAEELLDFLQT
jgi:hypothetical protein